METNKETFTYLENYYISVLNRSATNVPLRAQYISLLYL